MSVLVLTRKPLSERPVDEWLADLDEPVVLVASSEGALGVTAEDYLHVQTFEDLDSFEVDQAIVNLADRFKVDRIVTSGERDVIRAARLRERLSINGQTLASATAYRDKVRMKELAARDGVAVPAFRAIEHPSDLITFVAEVGYPVVLKPRLSGGSRGVQFVRDDRDLEKALASGNLPAAPERSGWLEVEEFVDAPFHCVDGVMVNGEPLHCWPSRYGSGNAEATQFGAPLSSWYLDADSNDCAALQKFSREVLAALPAVSDPTAFHLEAWITASGPILCEVASRPGGGATLPTYERAFGVNLARESLRGQAGLPPTVATQPSRPRPYAGQVEFTPRLGTCIPPQATCPIPGTHVASEVPTEKAFTATPKAGDGVACYTVTGSDSTSVHARIEALVAWWDEQVVWA